MLYHMYALTEDVVTFSMCQIEFIMKLFKLSEEEEEEEGGGRKWKGMRVGWTNKRDGKEL